MILTLIIYTYFAVALYASIASLVSSYRQAMGFLDANYSAIVYDTQMDKE